MSSQPSLAHLLSLDHLFSLHRYFIWANKMRVHFDMLLQENIPRDKGWDIETRL